jgi:hypothetical protein
MKNLFFLSFPLILLFALFFFSHLAYAQSHFDSEDDLVFESDETLQFDSDTNMDSDFDDDSMIDDDAVFIDDALFHDKESIPKNERADPGFFYQLLNDSRFTLGYEFSNNLVMKPSFITHDTYLRSEIQTLLSDNLFFQFDGRTNCFFDNDHRTQSHNKSLFIDSNLRELFFQKGFGQFNITFGRQIVVWGKADTQIITDVVSPRDNSDFIFIQLENSRFGQLMLSSDIYTKWGNFFIFVSPKPLTDNEPEKGTQYYLEIPGLIQITIRDDKPTFADTEYGIRWKQNLNKVDISFMAGYFFENTSIYHFSGIDYIKKKQVVEKIYHTYEMIGLAASYVSGAYLYKIETAFKKRMSFQIFDIKQFNIGAVDKDILDLGIGVEYNANGRYQISGEISNRFIPGNTERLLYTDKNSTSIYTTFSKDFYNETVAFEYIFFYHVQDQNNFHQFRLTREIKDNFQLIASSTFFSMKDKESLLWFYRNEDRLSVEFRYYF